MKLKILLSLIVLVLVGLLGYLSFPLLKPKNGETVTDKLKDLITTTTSGDKTLLTGNISLLAKDLELFDFTNSDMVLSKEEWPATKYYEAGTYNSGDFKGYKRIVVVQEPLGPAGPSTYIFATKDNKTYVVNGNAADAAKYPENDYRNPYYSLNKAKVTGIADLDMVHPKVIKLNDDFILFKREILSESVDSKEKTKEGYDIYTSVLITDFTKDTKLSFEDSNVKFYNSAPYVNPNAKDLKGKDKTENDISEKYIGGDTSVSVVDTVGLGVSYTVATTKNYEIYKNQLKTEEYPDLPNMRFSGSAITPKGSYFDKYDTAFPGGCGGGYATPSLKNVSDTDFVEVGTVNGFKLFSLKDKSHPLYTLAYGKKIDLYADSFQYSNPDKVQPTVPQYISKMPLLFMKDFWGRWIVFVEYDYELPGDCGKPVVYLYPTTPTDVSVKFATEVKLTTQIPNYSGGWNVKAYPNGNLVDLQPQATECEDIDVTHAGSEYAANACKTGVYPYIYWAGTIVRNEYPRVNKGWVVEKKNLATFMDDKLTEMGLNNTEKADMTSYWVQKMLNENSNYYRVSFLQTNDMNRFVPMAVKPTPDTVFRIFLDYQALESKPETELQPQNLTKLVRNGFTFVEWGGLLK